MRTLIVIGAAALAAAALGAAPAAAHGEYPQNLVSAIAQNPRYMDGPTANRLAEDLREDHIPFGMIEEALTAVRWPNGRGGRWDEGSLGAFVSEKIRSGLRNRKLADAIHDEVARRAASAGDEAEGHHHHGLFQHYGDEPGHSHGVFGLGHRHH